MVIVVKGNTKDKNVEELMQYIRARKIQISVTEGTQKTILGLIGDTASLDVDALNAFEAVESVKRIQEPYKKANRAFHQDDTSVDVGGYKIGGGSFQVIAGPCSVESEAQIKLIAESVHRSGANLLRGGAFKPRTSPYAFQGLEGVGLKYLLEAKEATGLPIVTEIMNVTDLPLFENVDLIQVGARNMQNFALLKELGKTKKPILLKRGLANTMEELLMSAEYIMAGGNGNVILCERGIRTFETMTRNTLDLSAIPVLKKKTHLPIIVDPSHATGKSELVEPMSLAAIAAGADGLIIEVHNNPSRALCDGAQSLDCAEFERLMKKLVKMRALTAELLKE